MDTGTGNDEITGTSPSGGISNDFNSIIDTGDGNDEITGTGSIGISNGGTIKTGNGQTLSLPREVSMIMAGCS
jgi:hypothetical protein